MHACACLCSEFPAQSPGSENWASCQSPDGDTHLQDLLPSVAADSVWLSATMQKNMRHLPQGLPESLCYLLPVEDLYAATQQLHPLDSQTFLHIRAPWLAKDCVTLSTHGTTLSLCPARKVGAGPHTQDPQCPGVTCRKTSQWPSQEQRKPLPHSILSPALHPEFVSLRNSQCTSQAYSKRRATVREIALNVNRQLPSWGK